MGGACSAYGREERRIQGFGGETYGKDTSRKAILRRIFRKCGVGAWTGLMWLRIGTGGGHL